MDIARQRELLTPKFSDQKSLITEETVEEILTDKELTTDIHPLVAVAMNWLIKRHELAEKEKASEAILNDPCFKKLKPGEPFFVLRGQDLTAESTVLVWISKNIARMGKDHPKIISAQNTVVKMINHSPRKYAD